MNIYTRRGDSGETSLANGLRVRKDAERVEAYGMMDEAGCAVGLARSAAGDPHVVALLRFIQQRLMNCAALTARPMSDGRSDTVLVTDDDVTALERAIDLAVDEGSPWTGFVLEGGCDSAARIQLARSIVRRAERSLVALAAREAVDPAVMAFVNRTSDALYAAARAENRFAGHQEEPWDPTATPGF
jgi:cob(I)alamin adenosyltransferase